MTRFDNIFEKHKVAGKVYLLPVELIRSNPAQPRKDFDRESLLSLADSIKTNGLLQPLTVRRVNNEQFELIAGERRLMACKLNRMGTVPCLVESFSDQDSAMMALIENLQRRDLNFFEEASAIAALIRHWGITQEEVARRLGRSQSGVANKLRLLKLPESYYEIIIQNGLTERHVRALLTIMDDRAAFEKALDNIITRKLTVQQTEEYLRNPVNQPVRKKQVYLVRDVRLFANTIDKAIALMNQGGIAAISETSENEEYIEYRVKIPKQNACRQVTTIA